MSEPPADTKDAVLYRADDGVAWITLNRPEQRNAVSPELTAAMDAALLQFEQDDDAWVALLTGAGPNFCAGADLKALAAGRAADERVAVVVVRVEVDGVRRRVRNDTLRLGIGIERRP